MKKILILANNDGGLYKFRKELIQELLNQGNEVYLSLPNGEFIQKLESLGAKFVETELDRRGINPFTDFKLLVNYFKMTNQIKPDLIITYTIKPNLYGGIVATLKKIPYAINITGLGQAFQKKGFLKSIIVSLYKITCIKTRIVFFENEENKNIFINNMIVKKEKTYKLNGAGVNLEEFTFQPFPVNSNEIHFLFIGRIMKEKGIGELLEVAKRIKREHPNVYFDIVGEIEEDYFRELENLSEQKIINFHGFQSDIKPFIKKAQCFILPSYHEGMANTLLECAAMGRPLITSNVHGCKEAVIDGENGYLVQVKDSEDLYLKIKKFINLPLQNKEIMGKKSREHISNFDRKKVVRSTIEALNSE